MTDVLDPPHSRPPAAPAPEELGHMFLIAVPFAVFALALTWLLPDISMRRQIGQATALDLPTAARRSR